MVDHKNRPSCRLIEDGIQKRVEKLPLYKRQCKSRKKIDLISPLSLVATSPMVNG